MRRRSMTRSLGVNLCTERMPPLANDMFHRIQHSEWTTRYFVILDMDIKPPAITALAAYLGVKGAPFYAEMDNVGWIAMAGGRFGRMRLVPLAAAQHA